MAVHLGKRENIQGVGGHEQAEVLSAGNVSIPIRADPHGACPKLFDRRRYRQI